MIYAVKYDQGSLSHEDRQEDQHTLARRLLGYAMEREYGVPLSGLTIEKTPAGKPYFADHPAKFSLSHCRGMVCCAVSENEIGVDVELIRPVRETLVKRVCTESERSWLLSQPDRDAAFFSLWTLKESLMKLTGEGMAYGFQNAAFSIEAEGPRCLVPGASAALFHAVPGYVFAVCAGEKDQLPTGVELIPMDLLP